MDNEKLFFQSSDDGVYFSILFDKIFEKEKLEVYNEFDLSPKRNFKMINNDIRETYEQVFLNENGEVKKELILTLYQILNIQSKIMNTTDSMSVDTFLDHLKSITKTGNTALLKEIKKYVVDNYELTLDADTKKMKEKKKNVNDQIVISDEYAKIILQIAMLDRLMIPLISQFYIYNKGSFPSKVSVIQDEDDSEELVFADVNQRIFTELFNLIAEDNSETIKNKIFKLVYSRVVLTSASAKNFWNAASALGITKESASLDIYTKLLSNSIPKILISKDLNLVSFLSAIVSNQIVFLFSNKFKERLLIVSPDATASMFESNDDNMTEMERIEIQTCHKNEGSLIINNVISKEIISNIDEVMNVAVSKEEIANTIKYIHMNPIQEKIISLLTFKYFKGTDTIKRLDAYQYAKLLICCVKYLENKKYVLLPKILISKCIKQRDRQAITGVKIKSKIESSKRYKELLDVKFSDFKFDVEKNIQSIISTIYSSTFIDDRGDDVFESSAKIGNVAEEIVDLCFLI